MDSVGAEMRPECKVPLTGLLQKDGDHWTVPWDAIRAHLATLTVEEARGEKNHVLLPATATKITASIAGVEGTSKLDPLESMRALQCGRVIARIISDGDHAPTQIYRDTNWLVIARERPVAALGSKWIFVTLNPGHDKRESLPSFKYTPHYAAAPEWYGVVKPLSKAARDCQKRGLNACFVDPLPTTQASIFGSILDFLGLETFRVTGGSEPWVSCPAYGCCCGGTKCHT